MHRAIRIAARAGVLAIALGGCASDRPPLDPVEAAEARLVALPKARIWGDAPAADILKFAEGTGITPGNTCHTVAPTMLALSGGAEDGAFGAGYLVGWSATGQRPSFDVVTGVSTGALIAPMAFLGPEYDTELAAAYLETRQSSIFVDRPFPLSLLTDALVGSAPLQARIERVITPEILGRIATEHARGRRLFVSTTNLDSQRPVIWDLGAIASSADLPAGERLIEQVILASAAIPGIFPPVLIETTLPSGKTIREMHVDGATTGNILAAPVSFIDFSEGAQCPHPLQLFAIVNGRLGPEFATVPRDALSIAERGLATVLKSFSVQALGTAKALDDKGVVDLQVISIGSDFAVSRPEKPFDQSYMKRLFKYGNERAKSP